MEFTFDVKNILPGVITVLESNINESDIKIYSLDPKSTQVEKQDANFSWIYHSSANSPWDIKLKSYHHIRKASAVSHDLENMHNFSFVNGKKEDLETIVDEMGFASAQAQGLRSPITTLKKLLNSKNQKIYIMRDGENNKVIIGFLKIGIKRLFVCDDVGAHHEVDPLCILDFYVQESKQRCGFGHQIFNVMLEVEKVLPEKLAVDRPSFKFLSFLNKHYNLKNPIAQTNNFVIYPGFFVDRKALQPVKCNNYKKQYSQPSSYTNEAEAFNSIRVSLCSDELKKNKTFYSSAANCLMWNDEEKVSSCNKKYCSPKPSSRSVSTNSSNVKSSGNWHVHSSIQNCSNAHKKVDEWSSSHSSPCSLTPVNTVPNYSQKKWDQLQSSWNILGVKPVDYAVYQDRN